MMRIETERGAGWFVRASAWVGVAAVVASTSVYGAEAKRLWAKSFLGEKGPELVVEEWVSEKPDVEGKFVLIDFWATWCGPCRKAIPELNEFHKAFGDRLVVIGISDESKAEVVKMTAPKMEYFSAVDTQGRTKKAYEVKGIPHVVILDPEGVVRWEGYPLLAGHKLTKEVVAGVLDAGKSDAKAEPEADSEGKGEREAGR